VTGCARTFLERHLSNAYVSTFPDGTVLDKKAEIASLSSGAVVISAMQASEMQAQVYGKVVVITGRSTITAEVNGNQERGEFRFIDVWVKSKNGWQAVASQVTRIARS
jgi:Domain of unknown function (DUF4440)